MKGCLNMTNYKIELVQKIGTICGMLSSVVYILHVFLGANLWGEYSSIKQPISDLTGEGAPNAELLRIFTGIYGVLAIFFAVTLYLSLKKYVNIPSKIGMVLLIIMEISSFLGYSLFPLDDINAGMTFQSLMHIMVTAIVVITTIGSTFFIGIGFRKIENMGTLGSFIILCGCIITISGASTGIVISNSIPILGVIEHINIFTVQLMIFILSLFLAKNNKYRIVV